MRPPEKLPLNPDGSLTLGKITVANVTEEEYERFRVYQYAVTVVKPGVDRLAPARHALEARENDAALAYAVDAVGVDESERHRIIAKALARKGNLHEAEEQYRNALATRRDPTTVGELGILLVGRDRLEEAEPLLKEALAANPADDRVLGALGLLHATQGDGERAFNELFEALGSNFEHTGLLPAFVQTARRLDRLAEAVPVLKRYVEFFPGNLDLACDFAEILFDLDRPEEAQAQLDHILLFAPDHDRAQRILREHTG